MAALVLLYLLALASSASACCDGMTINSLGLFIAESSVPLVDHVYNDPAGNPTVCYGHLVGPDEQYPPIVSQQECVELLKEDLESAGMCVQSSVLVPLNTNQFSSLVDFTYSLGCGTLQSSTLLRVLNQGNFFAVPVQMMRWTYAGGRQLASLVKRRQEEIDLWNTAPTWNVSTIAPTIISTLPRSTLPPTQATTQGTSEGTVTTPLQPTPGPNTTFPNTTWPNTTWPNTTWPNTTWPNTTWPNTTWPNTTWPNTTFPNTTWPNTTFPNTTWPNTTWPNSTWPIDPNSTWPIDPNSTWPIDPNSTWPIDPNSTWPIDPNSTWPIDPNSTWPIDPNSTWPIDPNSTWPLSTGWPIYPNGTWPEDSQMAAEMAPNSSSSASISVTAITVLVVGIAALLTVAIGAAVVKIRTRRQGQRIEQNERLLSSDDIQDI